MTLQFDQFACREDNFGVLMHDPDSGQTALIDAPEERAILAAIERTGWTPTVILTTHHHADHVEANMALKERFGLKIIGPEAEKSKIPGIDQTVGEGSLFKFGGHDVHVFSTPGHTLGHVTYYLPAAKVAFTADTLFALGCGRIFEGTPPMMYASLMKLAALPAETTVYCGHEYTLSNARFAVTIDPSNPVLRQRAEKIAQLRGDDRPTLPTTIGEELATNPYLRTHDPAIRRGLNMETATDEAVFAEIRKRKDNF